MLAKAIKTKDGYAGREYPEGLVINGSPTKEPSSAIHLLHLSLGNPVAVIQASPQSSSSAATTAAAL
jgi:hypothetical protein